MDKKEVSAKINTEGGVYRRFYKNYEYFIVRRNAHPYGYDYMLELSGYINIPETSCFYVEFKGYDVESRLEAEERIKLQKQVEDYIKCHGGVSYYREIEWLNIKCAIGFFCSERDDYTRHNPEPDLLRGRSPDFVPHYIYRDVKYVDQECKSIIDQIINTTATVTVVKQKTFSKKLT